MAPTQIDDMLKPLLLKDLRIQCRARGINPGGSREALQERVKDHMMETGNFGLVAEWNGEIAQGVPQPKANRADHAAEGAIGVNNNNYSRSSGQNVGNFLTDRPSSRVLAPPGGQMSWSMYGDMPEDKIKAKPAQHMHDIPVSGSAAAHSAAPLAGAAMHHHKGGDDRGEPNGGNNNYSRAQGQNVGNFLTDKPSSRVLAPPGGGSSIVFG